MCFVLWCKENVLTIYLSYIHMNTNVFKVEDILVFFLYQNRKSLEMKRLFKNYAKKSQSFFFIIFIKHYVKKNKIICMREHHNWITKMLYNIHVRIWKVRLGREFIVQCLLVFGFVRYPITFVLLWWLL